jgi:glutathione S-transferase
MQTPELTFYFAPGSSSMAPHIALHEIGVPFTSKPVSFARKEQREPAFRAVNPEGKVPALVVDGQTLSEVLAILFFLGKRFPEANLLPHGDLAAEAQILSWMSFIASTIHPARRIGADVFRTTFVTAEQRLGAREWAVDRYSVADIHLFRLFWRFRNAYKPEPAEFPNLTAHHDRMMARPAVQRTIEVEAAIGYELSW